MKIFQLAKELGVGSSEVMSAMRSIGIVPPDNHFCNINDDQVDAMRRLFVRRALSDGIESTATDSESRAAADTSTPPREKNPSPKSPEPTAPIIVRRAAGSGKKSARLRTPTDHLSMPSSILGKSVKEKTSE